MSRYDIIKEIKTNFLIPENMKIREDDSILNTIVGLNLHLTLSFRNNCTCAYPTFEITNTPKLPMKFLCANSPNERTNSEKENLGSYPL